MSKENKEIKNKEEKEMQGFSSDWIWVLLVFSIFFGSPWNTSDTKDHELRERVARLEGQMDMIRR